MSDYSSYGTQGSNKNAQVLEQVKSQFALANAQLLLKVNSATKL